MVLSVLFSPATVLPSSSAIRSLEKKSSQRCCFTQRRASPVGTRGAGSTPQLARTLQITRLNTDMGTLVLVLKDLTVCLVRVLESSCDEKVFSFLSTFPPFLFIVKQIPL